MPAENCLVRCGVAGLAYPAEIGRYGPAAEAIEQVFKGIPLMLMPQAIFQMLFENTIGNPRYRVEPEVFKILLHGGICTLLLCLSTHDNAGKQHQVKPSHSEISFVVLDTRQSPRLAAE